MKALDAGADQQTLACIKSFLARNGFPPSIRELGECLGIGVNGAYKRLLRLVEAGLIVKEPGARAIRIVE